MYGPELLEAFREFKAIWDPRGRMNPGKVVDPYPISSNLRLGPDYRPPKLETRFHFPTEGGGFDRVAMRCVGIGTCRRHSTDAGVMCPSDMATREERHSTRGRARLLFEMLHGGPIKDRWQSREVEEALELCLACKGCKHDCPVNVDMATYKAEFRSHYYADRVRPRAAYSMGMIYWWSRAASLMPGVVNLLTQTPGLSVLAKYAGGLARERRMPAFPRETFRDWFHRYRPRHPAGPEVLLFPDTLKRKLCFCSCCAARLSGKSATTSSRKAATQAGSSPTIGTPRASAGTRVSSSRRSRKSRLVEHSPIVKRAGAAQRPVRNGDAPAGGFEHVNAQAAGRFPAMPG
jgi:ferredoxin